MLLSFLLPLVRALAVQERQTSPSTINALPGNWTYSGCWSDNVPDRVLTGPVWFSDTMTNELCLDFCEKKSYLWAGTEYSGQCYCGYVLDAASNSTAESDCAMSCAGDSSEICGGPNRLSLFNSGLTAPAGPYINTGPGDWASMGCYTDSVGGRALSYSAQVPGGGNNMSVVNCVTQCEAQGFILAGVEYSGECYCGNQIINGNGAASDGAEGCNMPCYGNSSEYCGGANRLNMYTIRGWKSQGCFVDSVDSRSLSTIVQTAGGSENMTIERCTAACEANNYTYAGAEYGGECYCGNELTANQTLGIGESDDCNIPCNGNSAEICGGSLRLGILKNRGSIFSSSISSSSSIGLPSTSASTLSSTTTRVDTTSSVDLATTPVMNLTSTKTTGSSETDFPNNSLGPTVTSATPIPAITSGVSSLPGNFTYGGCYIDNVQGRIFTYQAPDNSSLTVESCIETCINLGYSVAGMEYSSQCFCDDFIRNGGNLTSESDCNMQCAGDSTEKCGSGNRLSVYASGKIVVYQPPAAQQTDLPGFWAYQGCLEDAAERTFMWQLILTNNNSATTCLTRCAEYGYGAAGMEYGEECYCGDVDNVAALDRSLRSESECNMVCSGDAQYICGGGDRLSYYAWTGGTLSSWSFAEGTAAGQYQFLIGGLIVPLVATQGINGKVTFLEKFGTGMPNATGAYELDLTMVDNFTAAWRPMHVKTDIFCSASITLPDRAGRQLNIGGWSWISLLGTRLYSPDGAVGEWGQNDWEENWEELALQEGRWYPSAMIMANGSILVAGGETGSNAGPVPTLEIMPKPEGGGTVYCDWLNETDPYNLYPFLAVLPSGGIFVAYYNQARILDENTLETTRTLPGIPGAVNRPDGGRSYPFSGTMMLMPQHAPYSDPLTVLICGGSGPGSSLALDNCVSTQPEVDGARWVIERMPSQRVISCMVALPDGTYLILNGAQAGAAGFGLATNPNHNAVLYDPAAPLYSRMTVMANTTISRLYHSEAIPLQDGRVLISGSDPEDDVNSQEYRIEVFLPPYLLNGLPRPSFALADNETDWEYSSSYTLELASISTGSVRVSILGAESSTHGVTFGQRTLFPEVSCAGTTCTVTAPPNAHVCPPGWYQLFVLDGPTPSKSTFVRIGGDPAELGNWPQGDDFIRPGM